MRDYWLTNSLLTAVGMGYLVFALVAVVSAFTLPKRLISRIVLTVVVVVIVSAPLLHSRQQYQQAQAEAEQARQRLEEARLLFEERCKGAGERIVERVTGVEGIRILKLRSNKYLNLQDQFTLEDPYGYDFDAKGNVHSMLWPRRPDGELDSSIREGPAYRYVIYPGSSGGDLMQAELGPGVLQNGAIEVITFPAKESPRYGVTYEDISTPKDREFWIAGSSLKVVDLTTGKTIAERVGWMMDPGQGDKSGWRSPWEGARWNACPEFPRRNDRPIQIYQTRNFVEKVLQPKGLKK